MESVMLLLGRILLASIFVYSFIGQTMDLGGTQAYMAEHNIPFTGFLLVASLALRAVGSIFVLIGYQTRLGALLLALFMLPVILIFNLPLGMTDMLNLMENVAILGGLLVLAGSGPGAIAVKR